MIYSRNKSNNCFCTNWFSDIVWAVKIIHCTVQTVQKVSLTLGRRIFKCRPK